MADANKPNASTPDARLAADLAALQTWTQGSIPPWRALTATLHAARGTPKEQGESIMQRWQHIHSRRRLGGALASVALVVGLLMWPVSYQRTVGHTVELTVSMPPTAGDAPTADGAPPPRALAQQVKAALHAEGVRVEVQKRPDSTVVKLTARVPLRARGEVDRRTAALVQTLQALPAHPQVQANVSERQQQVSGRVYAMALDKLIQIRVDTAGKSDAEVTAEVEAQLRAQGIASPSVHFERHGDEKQLSIQADTGDRQIQVVRKSHDDGNVVEVSVGDIDTQREPGMTDDQLKDKILRQLTAKGMTGTVTVVGDHIEIRAERHHAP